MRSLAAAPPAPVASDGTPRFGTYAGSLPHTDLGAAARALRLSRFDRLAREKRWVWFGAWDEELAIGGAVVDLGYLGSSFFWVLDRRERNLLVDASKVSPPGSVSVDDDGARAGTRLRIERAFGGFRVTGRQGGAEVELHLAPRARAMTAVCPVSHGVNVTRKEIARVTGDVTVNGQRHQFLPGASAMIDATHGFLARETTWHWAAGSGRLPDGRPMGLNLVAGFNDGLENVVWLADQVLAVGPAHFAREGKDPFAPWRVTTEDGAVDLTLTVEGVRREDVDLRLVVSRYLQPIGTWRGRLGSHNVELTGVAEDHLARW